MSLITFEDVKKAVELLDFELTESEMKRFFKDKVSQVVFEQTGKYLNEKIKDPNYNPKRFFLMLRDSCVSLFGLDRNSQIHRVVRGVAKTENGYFKYDTEHYWGDSVVPIKCVSGTPVDKAIAYKTECYPNEKSVVKFSPEWVFDDGTSEVGVSEDMKRDDVLTYLNPDPKEGREYTYPIGCQLLFVIADLTYKQKVYAVKLPD